MYFYLLLWALELDKPIGFKFIFEINSKVFYKKIMFHHLKFKNCHFLGKSIRS